MKHENTTGSFIPKSEENSYGYYSKLLKKPFDTLEELTKAEVEYKKAHAAEIKHAEARKAKAKEVEDAYRELENAEKKANEMIALARKKALTARNEFIKEFGPYHATVTKVVDINKFFDELNETLNSGIFGNW